MSETASHWIIDGMVWRHIKTGELGGAVQAERDAKGNYLCGRVDRSMHWLIFAAFALFVLASGWTYRRGGIASALPVMAIVGACASLAMLAVYAGYSSASLKVRALAGVAVVLALMVYHAPTILILAAGALAVGAVASRYYSPTAVNSRMRAQGFRETVPDGFTGYWPFAKDRHYQYENGRLIAIGMLHRAPDGHGRETTREFFQPFKSAQYPYGWVFDASVPGYVPRRTDSYESPVPAFVHHVPEPDIDSRNKPRPGDDIGPITIVRHQYTRPDGKVVQADFQRPGPSRKYPYGWVFDPSVPGYMPRQGDPYESPAPHVFPDKPKTGAYGANKPRTAEQLKKDGAAHRWRK